MSNKKKITVKDLKPQRAEFLLSQFPKQKFHIRPFNLKDEIWLEENYGSGRDLERALEDRRAMAKVAWHQLEERELFAKKKVTIINDEGDKTEGFLGGLELFAASILGAEDQVAVAKAIAMAFGVSQPMIDELIENQKKKRSQTTEPEVSL